MSSVSMRASTSIELRPTDVRQAVIVSRSPMYTGCLKIILSMATVTQRLREWRIATAPPASSTKRKIAPPCTLPQTLASGGCIERAMTICDSPTVFPLIFSDASFSMPGCPYHLQYAHSFIRYNEWQLGKAPLQLLVHHTRGLGYSHAPLFDCRRVAWPVLVGHYRRPAGWAFGKPRGYR